MIKLGIIDFDSSHCVEFTKRINHVEIDKEQWVDGAEVVLGWPGESAVSPERIAGFTATMKDKLGVKLVDKPGDMIGKVDAVLIESVDGSVHWQRAKPFLEAGIPCFVDKPFACTLADAREITALSEKKKLPMFSASSLRYAPEVVEYLSDAKHGPITGCLTYGPASTHERNPGFFHYGIHAVEVLFTLMGPGCKQVTCTQEKGTDVATGRWSDGRVASIRGIRSGKADFGFTAFAEKSVQTVTIGTKFIYRELLKKVIETFKTGKPPIDVAVSLEIVAFIEAANKSGANHGTPESIKI